MSEAPKHLGNQLTLEAASYHALNKAATYLTQVKIWKNSGMFELDTPVLQEGHVRKTFWNNVRTALEYKQAARDLGPDTTVADWIEIRTQQLENKV